MRREGDFLEHTPYKDLDLDALSDLELHRLGVSLFNEGFYFETHEVWEELWMSVASGQRLFYQGLIQLAASLVHAENKNWSSMNRLMDMAFEKLRPYPETYEGVELKKLCTEMETFRTLTEPEPEKLKTSEKPKISGAILDIKLPGV